MNIGNYNIKVKTEKQWRSLVTLLEKIDPEIKWGGRLRPTELCNFDMFEENTIFILKDKFLTYGDTEDLSIISELDYTDFVALINIMKE